jgi:prepilin-type N-terminal cleavage/methylation domain-containing protein
LPSRGWQKAIREQLKGIINTSLLLAWLTPQADNERQNTMQIKHRRNSGFTLVEIMIVVAIIGLLASIAIPNFVKARATSQKNGCINNLRQIDGAKQQLLLEKGDSANLDNTSLTPYLGRGANGQWPTCPTTQNDTYTVGDKDNAPTCSYNNGHNL